MIIALIDNGSLEPAAHRALRRVATQLSNEVRHPVHAVSWKHSDRIAAAALDGTPALTVANFVRHHRARGEREFVFVPFFISAQGAIGSALREDLERLSAASGSFEFQFSDGLAARGVLPAIVADRIRQLVAARALDPSTPVIVVDHGGPSEASAKLRDAVAADVRRLLAATGARVVAASMEGDAHAHNRPLLAEQLTAPGFTHGDVVVAPLFLLPGRHAGADGDLAQIARRAEATSHESPLRCHFTDLVGTHPQVVPALAAALRDTLASVNAHPFA